MILANAAGDATLKLLYSENRCRCSSNPLLGCSLLIALLSRDKGKKVLKEAVTDNGIQP
jgi:hypothetical protein